MSFLHPGFPEKKKLSKIDIFKLTFLLKNAIFWLGSTRRPFEPKKLIQKVPIRSPKSDDRPAQNQKFLKKVLPAAKSDSSGTVRESAIDSHERLAFALSPFAFD